MNIPRGRIAQHHRVSSDSQMEEHPSWLNELINESETPVQRNVHRRSSSDSFVYTDLNYGSCNNMVSVCSWGSQDFGPYNNAIMQDPFDKRMNCTWDSICNPMPIKNNTDVHDSFFNLQEGDGVSFTAIEDTDENGHNDMKDYSLPISSSETDMKRTKQQFAQRSRVRKLRYIAELERSVHVLQIQGCGICAELEFLSHQNLILNMENKALKQRLENISQEHVIKCLEHEVLEREIRRLQSLYQQQRQHQLSSRRPSPRHRQTNSFDLDTQICYLN
ncbi:uncharacterized protein At4g06598-like [Impatiens glandulifera]|uniref:uncharacterized protein At4g06598-like n=1 Tax=Impatiens glandulifera TaxID=253017 RepID=UPI001FB117F8|nr:uncharacterized protein At4g06598-like [Impatiens glandulifera]